MKITKEIIQSGIYGLAVGDALGVPYEFCQRERMAEAPCMDMIGFGVYDKPAGTWSDDTSMTLAQLDGLAAAKSERDFSATMNAFLAWLNESKYTVDGVFDVGRTCMDAILNYARGISPKECGGKGEFSNGNGSLMRILPVVLYSLLKHGTIDYQFVGEMSALTHGHAISKTACGIYARLVQALIQKEPLPQSVVIAATEADHDGLEGFDRLRSAGFMNLPKSEIKSRGYVVDTLEAAIWCFWNAKSYKDCVLTAVNLGGDTDTIAAVVGSLAGLYYGLEAIPNEWVETLRGKEIIDQVIDNFVLSIKS
jgi:ADP-ribosylglycohydrolase